MDRGELGQDAMGTAPIKCPRGAYEKQRAIQFDPRLVLIMSPTRSSHSTKIYSSTRSNNSPGEHLK